MCFKKMLCLHIVELPYFIYGKKNQQFNNAYYRIIINTTNKINIKISIFHFGNQSDDLSIGRF